MKEVKNVMLGIVVIVFGLWGCKASTVELRYAREYNCPRSQVTVADLGGEAYRATGCGQSATYSCQIAVGFWSNEIVCRAEGPATTSPGWNQPAYTPPAPPPQSIQPLPIYVPTPPPSPLPQPCGGGVCPVGTICDKDRCMAAPAPAVQFPQAETGEYTPTASTGYVPESVPWILQLNVGYGGMFSGFGSGVEVGYAGEYIGGTAFFNLGYLFGGNGAFGYGGGARFLVGHNPHFGYVGLAYTLVALAEIPALGITDTIWGPSLVFGYQYTGALFRVFGDLGFSWIGEAWGGQYDNAFFGTDVVPGTHEAVFTFDLGIGIDVLGWANEPR